MGDRPANKPPTPHSAARSSSSAYAPLAGSEVRRRRLRGLGNGLAHATPRTGPVAHHGVAARAVCLVFLRSELT